jgi:hypothetical protein
MVRYFLLLSTLVLSQNPSPRPTPQTIGRRPPNQIAEETQQHASEEQRGSEKSPFIIKVLPSENTQSESQRNGDNRPSNPNNSWGLSDRIAVIASIVAFFQFVALVWTVLVMIWNGRRQLRAYVLPENVGIFEGNTLVPPQPVRANIPGISMYIKNCGQTPAYKVISWANIAVIPVIDENRLLVVPTIPEQFSNTLGSNGTFSKSIWFDRPLSPNEIADIATGIRAIYLYGSIAYKDAFKKNRTTNFRLQYIGEFPPPPNVIFHFSERGNDAN